MSKNDIPDAHTYKDGFLIHLKGDIDNDILESGQRLDELQQAVEQAKVLLKCSQDVYYEDNSMSIESKRRERNLAAEEYQKLLHVRENIRELMESEAEDRNHHKSFTESIRDSFRSKKGSPIKNPLHSIYIECHAKIREIKGQTLGLLDKKVLMISVKEAIRNTLEEIRETNKSQGLETDHMGRSRATHVLRQSKIPKEWLTLTEKVAVILADERGALATKHRVFIERVINQCKAALFEKHLLDLSVQEDDETNVFFESSGEEKAKEHAGSSLPGSPNLVPEAIGENTELLGVVDHINHDITQTESDEILARQLQNDLNRNSLISLEGEIGSEDVVIVHDTDQDHLKKAIDSLKGGIHNHLQEAIEQFHAELKLSTTTSHKKLWLCYEAHFYDAVAEHLMRVYEFAYSHISEKLCQCIPELSTNDLNLEDTVVAGLLEDTTKKSFRRVNFASESDKDMVLTCDGNVATMSSGNEEASNSEHVTMLEEETAARSINDSSCSEEDFDINKMELLRQMSAPHSDQTEPSLPCGDQIKRVTIHYPSSVTMIYNRRTWPLPQVQTLTGEFERGMDALMMDSDSEGDEVRQIAEQQTATLSRSNSMIQRQNSYTNLSPAKKMRVRPKFRHHFVPVLDCIHDAISDTVPLVKLQHLTRCLREIVESISSLNSDEFHMPMGACCDNLLDMLVILLCNCQAEVVSKLYAHVMMLTDLMPPCLEHGPYEYSLLQFFGAFQIIHDRVVAKSRSQQASAADHRE